LTYESWLFSLEGGVEHLMMEMGLAEEVIELRLVAMSLRLRE
jgi:hypothetical protein